MGDTKQKIGQLIREIRKQKGMTQEDLAARLNVNRVVISEYERGQQNMTLDTVDKVAAALGVEVTLLIS